MSKPIDPKLLRDRKFVNMAQNILKNKVIEVPGNS
jgi:hypothetical protein